MPLKIQQTEDGSSTLFSEEFDEIYHSRHGAWQESLHVFIEAGLKHLLAQKTEIHILEIGFGTGLNALLTLAEVKDKPIEVHYYGIEPLPVEASLVEAMSFPQLADRPDLVLDLKALHQAEWEKEVSILPNFHLHKIQQKIAEWNTEVRFDLIYFDAFAPSKHPEMWEEATLKHVAELTSQEGILVTYCAKGYVKRNLKSVGFQIEALPGPPKKREMTRGTKR